VPGHINNIKSPVLIIELNNVKNVAADFITGLKPPGDIQDLTVIYIGF
jgi:hypothetical protein